MKSSDLKAMISTWLSTPEARADLKHHSDCDPNRVIKGWGDQPDENEVDYAARLYGFRKGCTPAELEEFIWQMWCDGSQWKREEKRTLKDEAEDTFGDREYLAKWDPNLPGNQQAHRQVPSFPCDILGDSNEALVKKYFEQPDLAKKCVYRMFVPNNQLADNYRLEVITTHDDSEVVGWWVTVD